MLRRLTRRSTELPKLPKDGANEAMPRPSTGSRGDPIGRRARAEFPDNSIPRRARFLPIGAPSHEGPTIETGEAAAGGGR